MVQIFLLRYLFDDDDEAEEDHNEDIGIIYEDDDEDRNLNILSTFSIKTTHLFKIYIV